MTMGRGRLAVVAAALCLATASFAQDSAGRIDGLFVKEDKGIPAVVVLINELKLTAVTDVQGRFVFESVPAGTYTLIFTLGNRSLARPNVIVTAGKTHSMTIEVDWKIVTEVVRVTAAAQAAKIVDAPSAVTSISEVQIERQAAHGQVPKILEFTPGAEVTQSGLYDFNFNTRGFNSSLNRRVSTYIDGRDVGVVLLGAQEWAAISGSLDDVASLEFIRGPSAALYGANASSGVINITTKAPRDSLGTMVRVTTGEDFPWYITVREYGPALETQSMDFRRAQELGKGWYYKVMAGFKNSGDFTISRNPFGSDGLLGTADDLQFPEYHNIEPPGEETPWCMLVGQTDCLLEEKTLFIEQDNKIRYGSVRFDKYLGEATLLTFEAGRSDIEGPVFQTGIGRVQNIDSSRPFYRFGYSNRHWNLIVHHSTRDGNQANLIKALVINFELLSDTQRSGAEVQGHWDFGGDRGRIVVGAAHTAERVDTINPVTGKQTIVYEPITSNRQAVFSQLDWKVNDHFKLVFAGRVDQSTLHVTQFSPKAAVVYSINENNSVRFTFNRAFQVANYSEFFLHARLAPFPIGGFVTAICSSPALLMPVDCGISEQFIDILAVGNDDLELEKTEAWEIGYTGLLANSVLITVDYYNSDNRNFITDLVPQVGTILGDLEGCVDTLGNPITDPTLCPINNDYLSWVSTPEAESTLLFGTLTVAQALRNAVDNSVGGSTLGFRLAQDLDGSTVVIGRTYTNVGRVETQGVDFGLQYFVNEAWRLQMSYSWFDFEIIDADADVEGILLPNSPRHKASLSVTFSKNRWSAGASGRWVEGFRWSAGVFQGPVDDYYTADLTARVELSEVISLGLNVANVTDNLHRQTFGGDLLSRRALVNMAFHW